MSPTDPPNRPTDTALRQDAGAAPVPELLNLPWIDVHNHAQTLSWMDRERYALSGCEAMVMVAAGYHWIPYRPVEEKDIRYLWDDAFNRRPTIEANHLFSAKLAVGIHTGVRVDNAELLLADMDAYCAHDAVVAVGETGVTPTQQGARWELDEQRDVVREQFELATRHDLPAILHTPLTASEADTSERPGVGIPGYEKAPGLHTEPVIEADNRAVEALEIDLEAARDAGLSEDRIVASHVGPDTLSYLMEETDCFASFTLGQPWLLGVTVADVADAIDQYGPDRIVVDTDCANVLRTDPFAIKRAIFELYHRGIDPDAIRTVVYENPNDVFELRRPD